MALKRMPVGYPFPGSIDELVLNLPGASVVNTFSPPGGKGA